MLESQKQSADGQDAQVVAGVGGAIIKTGIAAVALVAAGPEAAVAATLATELTSVVLESQKQRLTDLAARFMSRTAELPPDIQERVRERLRTDAGSRIFETAWYGAAQEVNPEKLDFIAALLKNSLSAETLQEHDAIWLLKVLNELDPVQIIILQSFAEQNKDNSDFKLRHPAVFEGEVVPQKPLFALSPLLCTSDSAWPSLTDSQRSERISEECERQQQEWRDQQMPLLREQYQIARERHALYVSRVQALVEKGLVGANRRTSFFGDQTEAVSEALTPLGAAMLKIIDAIAYSEWGVGEQANAVQAMQQSLEDIAANAKREQEEMERALRRA